MDAGMIEQALHYLLIHPNGPGEHAMGINLASNCKLTTSIHARSKTFRMKSLVLQRYLMVEIMFFMGTLCSAELGFVLTSSSALVRYEKPS
jgi:hypothetical protein